MARVKAAALLLALACAPPAAHAERATERYAPVQLALAQRFLREAQAAAAAADRARAGELAWQASLDARLAWKMTDRAPLRAQAEAIAAQAADLMQALGRRAGPAYEAHAGREAFSVQ
jgi:hypothetical protein